MFNFINDFMDFKKDILLIDLEFTGIEPGRHEIIQLAAVLLDKKTLKEKKAFDSYIKPKKWKHRDPESMKVNNISFDQVKDAPSLAEVIADFEKLFDPKKVILSYYGGPLDMDFLRAAYKQVKKPFLFDYHYFNLWGVFFAYMAVSGRLKDRKKFAGFSLDDFMEEFKLTSMSRHDALEDCRIEAEVLRRVIANIQI